MDGAARWACSIPAGSAQALAVEIESSAFHRLYGSGSSYVVGAGFDVPAPDAGRLAPRQRDRLGRAPRDKGVAPAAGSAVREPSRPRRHADLARRALAPYPRLRSSTARGRACAEGQYMTGVLLRRGIAVWRTTSGETGSRRALPGGDSHLSRRSISMRATRSGRQVSRRATGNRRTPHRPGRRKPAGWIIPSQPRAHRTVSWALIESGPVVSVGETILFAQLTGQGEIPLTRPIEEIEDEVRRRPQWIRPASGAATASDSDLLVLRGLDRHQPTRPGRPCSRSAQE